MRIRFRGSQGFLIIVEKVLSALIHEHIPNNRDIYTKHTNDSLKTGRGAREKSGDAFVVLISSHFYNSKNCVQVMTQWINGLN